MKTGSDESFDYQIKLVRTRPKFGGVRFWFLCPVSGRRVAKLYLEPWYSRFVSRHVYKIGYSTQSMCPLSRMIEKKWRLVRKTAGDCFPVRPKGMHHKTFDKIFDQFIQQEDLYDEMLFRRFGVFL